jgi:hypothetical protein
VLVAITCMEHLVSLLVQVAIYKTHQQRHVSVVTLIVKLAVVIPQIVLLVIQVIFYLITLAIPNVLLAMNLIQPIPIAPRQ